MSYDIAEIKNTGKDNRILNLNGFTAPSWKPMVQLTQGFGNAPDEPGYIQLTVDDAYRVIGALAQWIKDQAEVEKGKAEKAIAENQALAKTIVKDAVECEHFISDLKVLDIPLRLLGLIKPEKSE